MAKYSLPTNESERSGRLGNLVFTRNRYGECVRVYRPPRNPRTPEQQVVRSRMRELTNVWHSLTLEQFTGWNDGVKRLNIRCKSKKGLLTGFAFFMKTNMNILNVNGKPIKNCPFQLAYPIDLMSAKVEVIRKPKYKDMLFRFEPDLEKNNYMVIYATHGIRTSRQPRLSDYKKIGVVSSKWNPGQRPKSIVKMYKKRYGSLPSEHESVWFKFQVIERTTGKADSPVYVRGEEQ